MNINICIVHYNTPRLTECLVRSINKFVPESTIYIFDNSDKFPFTYRQENIIYFDNTNGEIIDFNKWLAGISTKVPSINNHASAKHCYTIQKCMDLIDKPFILLDSDTLLKQDITKLFNEKYVYAGDTEKWQGNERVIPYCCFINTTMCKEKGIKYYNEKYIVGLTKSCRYDTGAYFYIKTKDLPHKNIIYRNYVAHLDDGSQKFSSSSKQDKFLNDNKALYTNGGTDNFDMSASSNYLKLLKEYVTKKVKFLNINIENPTTIQDKIQWLKIFDTTPLKTKCADKIKVHEYCKEKLGEDICIPIIKTYNKASEINWNELPNKFVIKCNHGSGMNIIVPDKEKLNKLDAVAKLNKWMATDFAFQNGYELQYHNIVRKIFVEEFKEDLGQKTSLFDYKFWCFNGEPKFYTINDGHGHSDWMNFYDMDQKELPCKRTDFLGVPKFEVEQPKNFKLMADYAKKLSEDFKFVRVDFYEVGGKVYLGELTFTPGSGFFKYKDSRYNKIFGDMLSLKNNKVIYTCITGSYELLDDPFVLSPGYDYVCFTNYDKIKSNIWKIRPIPEELNTLTEVKKQRCIKINPHKYLPEYNFSIWVDGSVKLKKDANEFVHNNCKNAHIFIPSHPVRKCIYEEMTACIKQKKDTEQHIAPQKAKYTNEGFPKNYGLVQSNIVMRYHNEPDCIKLMNTWWEEVKNGSHRDQLSFDYARWKNQDVKVVFLDKATCKTDYFLWDQSHGKSPLKRMIERRTAARQRAMDRVVESAVKRTESKANQEPAKIVKMSATGEAKTRINVQPTFRRQIISKELRNFLNSE